MTNREIAEKIDHDAFDDHNLRDRITEALDEKDRRIAELELALTKTFYVPVQEWDDLHKKLAGQAKEIQAYREIAILKSARYLNQGNWKDCEDFIDIEVHQIMEKK